MLSSLIIRLPRSISFSERSDATVAPDEEELGAVGDVSEVIGETLVACAAEFVYRFLPLRLGPCLSCARS